jgi:hypothetical protein
LGPILAMPLINAPSWKRVVKKAASDAEFREPASDEQLASLERALGVQLPQDLRELLLEFDGVTAHYGAGVIWPSSEIQRQNQSFRTEADFKELFMPFDHLLLFGEDGGGDLFAYAIQADGRIHRRDIFRWNHESDERLWSANCLEIFFERRAFE